MGSDGTDQDGPGRNYQYQECVESKSRRDGRCPSADAGGGRTPACEHHLRSLPVCYSRWYVGWKWNLDVRVTGLRREVVGNETSGDRE